MKKKSGLLLMIIGVILLIFCFVIPAIPKHLPNLINKYGSLVFGYIALVLFIIGGFRYYGKK